MTTSSDSDNAPIQLSVLIPDSCMYCAMGIHFLCTLALEAKEDRLCCCPGIHEENPDPLNLHTGTKNEQVIVTGKRGRPRKLIGAFEDQLAAGRKRAEREFKIEPGTLCEWAWRRNCGGGIKPVVGCSGRTAKHVHHGPDKSVLNNDRDTNISLICTFCHQLWHVRNDKYYPGERPEAGLSWLPNSPGQPIHSLSEIQECDPKEIMKFEQGINREIPTSSWDAYRARRAEYKARNTSTDTGTDTGTSEEQTDTGSETQPLQDESQ